MCVCGGGGGAYLKNLDQIILKCLNDMPWKLRRHKGSVILHHFKSFTIPSGGPFLLLGGGGVRTPCTPPAYGPEHIRYV